MLIRSLAFVLVIASSFIVAIGQTPEGKNETDKPVKPVTGVRKLRDLPFPAGVDLQFIIKELARDLDLNVLFDIESFRTPGRKTFIELKNVTAAAALDYVFLQERLFFEEAGPRTILVASQARLPNSIPQIGVGVTMLIGQLPQYFGVENGMLINRVRDNSPASKAGLKAGDVIVEIDGAPVQGQWGLIRALNEKDESEVILKIVRDRKSQTISVTPEKVGVASVL